MNERNIFVVTFDLPFEQVKPAFLSRFKEITESLLLSLANRRRGEVVVTVLNAAAPPGQLHYSAITAFALVENEPLLARDVISTILQNDAASLKLLYTAAVVSASELGSTLDVPASTGANEQGILIGLLAGLACLLALVLVLASAIRRRSTKSRQLEYKVNDDEHAATHPTLKSYLVKSGMAVLSSPSRRSMYTDYLGSKVDEDDGYSFDPPTGPTQGYANYARVPSRGFNPSEARFSRQSSTGSVEYSESASAWGPEAAGGVGPQDYRSRLVAAMTSDTQGHIVEQVGGTERLRYVPMSHATTLTSTPNRESSWQATSAPSAPIPHHILSTIAPRRNSITSDPFSISNSSDLEPSSHGIPNMAPTYQSVRHTGIQQRSSPRAWANPSSGATAPRPVTLSVSSYAEGRSIAGEQAPEYPWLRNRPDASTPTHDDPSFAERRQQLRALAQATPLSPAEEHEQQRQKAVAILADQLERLGTTRRPESTLINDYLDMGTAASAPLLAQKSVLVPTGLSLLPGSALEASEELDTSTHYKRASLLRARQGLSPTGADLEHDVLPSRITAPAHTPLSTPQRRAASLLLDALAQWRPASTPRERWQRAGQQSRLFGRRTSYSTPVRVMNPSGTLGVAEQVAVSEDRADWVAVYTDVRSQPSSNHVTVQVAPLEAALRPTLQLGGALGLTTGSIVDDAQQSQSPAVPAKSVRSTIAVRARVEAWKASNQRMAEVRAASAVLKGLTDEEV
jgi:hypothetical protein